jgi:hypothetical protein
MQARLWGGVAACAVLAVASGFAHARRARRDDPDRVGIVPWLGVQLFAMLAAVIIASFALNA